MLLSTTGSGQVTEKGSLEVGKLRAGSYGSWPQSSVYSFCAQRDTVEHILVYYANTHEIVIASSQQ